MPDKIDRQSERIVQANNTLGVDDLTTQPSAVEGIVDAKIPVEFGRYRLLKQLGEGGMGVVYLAHDIELDRQVALKLPHFSGTKSKDLSERFRREARLAATLDHPNICRIYDIGEHERRLFLTMNYVEGRSLHEIIRSKGAIDPRTSVALLRRIAQAVHFAHQRSVIHRDLKPANFMIKQNRDFVIMDFGLARRVDQEEAQLTATGAVLGTPAYMAPEQLRGEKGASGAQSDVYSLGIILYELLTGQRPFQGTAPQIYAQVLTTESVSPSSVRASIAPALDAIYQKATHKEVGLRYQSAEEFASALGQCLTESSFIGSAPQTVRLQQSKLPSRPEARVSVPPRNRSPKLLVALGGAAFFAILLGVIVVLVRNKDGTTTELSLPDDALAVEVQKDNRTLVTVNVADDAKPPTTQPTEVTSNTSQLPANESSKTSVATGPADTNSIVAVTDSKSNNAKIDEASEISDEAKQARITTLLDKLGARSPSDWLVSGVEIRDSFVNEEFYELVGLIKDLHGIHINDCKFAKNLPPLPIVPTLQQLHIFDCPAVPQNLLEQLVAMETLKDIWFWQANITDSQFLDLLKLRSLNSLRICAAPQVTHSATRLVSQAKELETLELSWGPEVTDETLREIVKLKKLQSLHIATDKPLCDAKSLMQILSLDNLTQLCVYGYPVDKKILEGIARMPELKELSLYHADLKYDDLKVLAQSKSLEILWMNDMRQLDLEDYRFIAEIPTLKFCGVKANGLSSADFAKLKEKHPTINIEGYPSAKD